MQKNEIFGFYYNFDGNFEDVKPSSVIIQGTF